MKKYIIYSLLIAAAAWAGSACERSGNETTGQAKSLDVETTELTFDAKGAAPCEIAVTAENLTWEFWVAESAAEWLHAERDGEKLIVRVDDNSSPTERRGSVTIAPSEAGPVKSRTVTVVQLASDEKYSLSVNPERLDFAGTDAEPQVVKVVTEGTGLTWHSEVEGDAKEWISVEEGDGTVTVSVKDTSLEGPRSGNILIVPSLDNVAEKVIRVEQAGLPPMFAVDTESIEFDYRAKNYKNIRVTAVNTEWTFHEANEAGDVTEISWLKTNAAGDAVRVEAEVNATGEERRAYVVLTPAAEGLEPVKVAVRQTAADEILSTLTGDLDLGELAGARATLMPKQTWDKVSTFSEWNLYLWEEGVSYKASTGAFVGTGARLAITLVSERINFNDDNAYYIPDGTYTVTALAEGETSAPGQLRYPAVSNTGHPKLPIGAWYTKLENDAYTKEQAPLVTGTLTVTRSGEEYTFVLDFEDDLGYAVAGSYTGAMELSVVGTARPEPTVE